MSKAKPQDKTAQATGKGPNLSAKGKEHLKALGKELQASAQGLEDSQRNYARGLERVSDTIQSINEPPREAAFPWGRASLALALLIVLELFAVIGAWQWGDGHNLLQKIGNFWWLLAFVFTAATLVSPLIILGREGWSEVKKKWLSWGGEA